MKKKGFTLIELLAVLVILAILALITIPIVLSIINNARENSYKRSIETYGRAVETAVMEYQMDHEELLTKISEYENNGYIKISGNSVECDDTIQGVDSEEGITLIHCYVQDKDGNKKSELYKYSNGKVTKELTQDNETQQEEPDTTTYDSYSVGDEITVAGDQYYVIADSGTEQDYVTALKSNPLTREEIINSGGSQYLGNSVDIDVYYGDTNDYGSSYVKSIVESWGRLKFTNNELKIVDGYSVRLIGFDEVFSLGYSHDPVSPGHSGNLYYLPTDETPNWIYSNDYSYWTMTAKTNSYYVWYVQSGNGGIPYYVYDPYQYNAVRPVINVYKNKILN